MNEQLSFPFALRGHDHTGPGCAGCLADLALLYPDREDCSTCSGFGRAESDGFLDVLCPACGGLGEG